MIRSDHVEPARSARRHLDVPVRRAFRRARAAAPAHAARRRRRRPGGPDRRRGRLRQEPARARVRRRGRARRRARAPRRLRRRGAHALRAVRRGARPADAGGGPRRAARGPAASSRASCPSWRRGAADGPARPTPTPTRSATGSTRRSPTCSRASPGAGRRCSCSRTATGPTPRRSTSCAISSGPGRRACSCSPPSATPRPTCRRRWRRRSPTCAATTSCGCASRGSRATRWPSSSGWRAGAELVPPELARAIRELTDGNPFLVCELWRALVETGAVELAGGSIRVHRSPEELGSPESIREVSRQRLARLAPRTTDVLELAATAGTEFQLELVRRAAGLDDAEFMAALDEAVRSGMIEEVPSPGLACRFAHELVRRALYDRLSGPRRAELHLRVGEALEAGGASSGRALVDLAHHFAAAAPFAPVDRAVAYNVRAARSAGRRARVRRSRRAAPDRAGAGHRRRGRARRGVPRARRRLPPGRSRARGARGLHRDGPDRPRARRRGAAGARGDRPRGGVLAARPRRPGRGRAARGGRDGARRRGLRAAGRAAQRARPRARPPGPPRARRRGARERRSRWRAAWTTAPVWRRS